MLTFLTKGWRGGKVVNIVISFIVWIKLNCCVYLMLNITDINFG